MKYYNTAQQAVENITKQSYLHTSSSGNTFFANKAVSERHAELKYKYCPFTEGIAHYANPEYRMHFMLILFFIGNVRHTIAAGNGSYTPVFLSELPNLFRKKYLN
jgi:acyl-CoA hydrolase